MHRGLRLCQSPRITFTIILKSSPRIGASAEPLPPSIYVSAKQAELVREKFGLEKNELLFGLNPGAEYGPAKRWPKERFAEAAAKLQTKCQARWVIFGGSADQELCDWIAGQIATLAPDKSTDQCRRENDATRTDGVVEDLQNCHHQ